MYFIFFSDERLMLETLEFTFYIGSTRKFLYFDCLWTLSTQHIAFTVLLYYCIVFFVYFLFCCFYYWNFLEFYLIPFRFDESYGLTLNLIFLFTIFLQLIRYISSLCFLGFCPLGWISMNHVCYYYHGGAMEFKEALKMCQVWWVFYFALFLLTF